jgi:glucosamine kinase
MLKCSAIQKFYQPEKQMILICDSGSTKADWIAGESSEILNEYHTKGFNPFFHDEEFIIKELASDKRLHEIKQSVKNLYFFGAGCSSRERNEIIRNALQNFFVNAEIIVEHDMLGTALAVCEGKPGLACILGTGSNTCFFDGKDIAPVRHGLGYIIGDEGSGSYYGKKLLSAYLYKIMPADLAKSFSDQYNLDKESVIKKVYNEPNANVFLASFATFLSAHANHPYIAEMVFNGMNEFFETNVLSYSESRNNPVHFVGSIAWYFQSTLKNIAGLKGIQTGNIIQKPVQGLADYFLNGGKMP